MGINPSAWRAVAAALECFRRAEGRRRRAGGTKAGRLRRAA
jgi:hypothetical protein